MSGGDVQADHRAPGHLDDERLAAFVDGALDGEERAAVELHLAACDACRVALAGIVRTVEGLEAEAGAGGPAPAADAGSRVVPRSTGRPGWRFGAAGLAAAAAAMTLFALWSGSRDSDDAFSTLLRELHARRLAAGRLAAARTWSLPPTTTRSDTRQEARSSLEVAALKVLDSTQSDTTVKGRHRRGLAYLAAGDVDEAIASLRAAASARRTDAEVLNDLSASLLERYRRRGVRVDLEDAITTADRAATMNPDLAAAWFNLGLARAAAGDTIGAHVAAERLLEIEPGSRWHEELLITLRPSP